MATIRLIPNTIYANSAATSNLIITDRSNAYTNTDSDTYAMIENITASTSSRFIYMRGFNFSDVPSNAIVNSFTIKLKARQSGGPTGTSYIPYICNGTATRAGTTGSITNSTQTLTFTGITDSWDTIKGFGSNFGIRVNCRRSVANTSAFYYIYGAEILVDYIIPVYHNVSVMNNSGVATVSPSGQQSVLEGSDFTVTIADIDDKSKISVTDNNVDVTSQLIESPRIIDSVFNPASFVSSNATVTDQDNALTGTDSTTYARMPIGTTSANYMIYAFDASSIPSDASIISVYCVVKASASVVTGTRDVQLYSGTVPKGSKEDIPLVTGATVTLSSETWTRQELENIRIRFDGYAMGSTSTTYINFYGADLTINYTMGDIIYTYAVSNIVTDHNIVINDVALQSVYCKVNNAWSKYSKIYVKQNNVWVEQSDFEAVFQSNKIYIDR